MIVYVPGRGIPTIKYKCIFKPYVIINLRVTSIQWQLQHVLRGSNRLSNGCSIVVRATASVTNGQGLYSVLIEHYFSRHR